MDSDLNLKKSGVAGCITSGSPSTWQIESPSPREWNLQPQEDIERRSPSGRRFESMSPTLFLVFINDIVWDMPRKVLGAIYTDDLVLRCSEEHLTTANYRLQQDWAKQWLVRINLHHLQPFNKGTEGQPAPQRPDPACWRQPHLPGGDFRQAADLETTNWKGWSQSQGATCSHEEVGRHDMGCRFCDSRETAHW